VEDGFVADGEFVVSGGDGAVAFESVDSAFDREATGQFLLLAGV